MPSLVADELTNVLREQGDRTTAQVEEAVHSLLDLAKQFGAASASARILKPEAEREQLQTELTVLENRAEAQRLVLPPDVIQSLLTEMREILAGKDTFAKR